jgi:hypothetical protein
MSIPGCGTYSQYLFKFAPIVNIIRLIGPEIASTLLLQNGSNYLPDNMA